MIPARAACRLTRSTGRHARGRGAGQATPPTNPPTTPSNLFSRFTTRPTTSPTVFNSAQIWPMRLEREMEHVAGRLGDDRAPRQRRAGRRRHRQRQGSTEPAARERAADDPRDHSDRVDRPAAILESHDAEGAGERPAAHDGARQRNDELRGRRLRASLVVRLRVVGSGHRQGAHRGGEDHDTEQGRQNSHAVLRVSWSLVSDPRGLARGLTNYGDADFSLYLRRSFATSMGYSREMLARPVVGIAQSASGFNNCHRHFPELIDAVKRGVVAAGGLPPDFPTISLGEGVLSPASTMASIAETLGMTLPGTAAIPAVHADRLRAAEASGRQAVALAAAKLRPSQIITGKSVENALRVLLAIGGSTNAIIHLTAIAGRVGVPISLERLNEMSDSTPVLVDLKPTGQHYMSDLHAAGGVGAVLRELKPLLHLDCLTVTGDTLGQRLAAEPGWVDRAVVRPLDDPFQKQGGLLALFGSPAPGGPNPQR